MHVSLNKPTWLIYAQTIHHFLGGKTNENPTYCQKIDRFKGFKMQLQFAADNSLAKYYGN